MRIRHAALPALLTVGALAAPAAASAATLTVNSSKSCYGAEDSPIVTGAGYTPGGPVRFALGQSLLPFTPTADATGGFRAAPGFALTSREQVAPYTAVDQTNPAIFASTPPIRFSVLALRTAGAGANGFIQRVRARGFTSGPRALYVHIRRGGRRIKDIRLGRARGACRTLNARKRFLSAGARSGTYRTFFDTFRRFSKKRKQQVRGTITVTRTFRRSAVGPGAAPSTSLSSAVGSGR